MVNLYQNRIKVNRLDESKCLEDGSRAQVLPNLAKRITFVDKIFSNVRYTPAARDKKVEGLFQQVFNRK